MDNLSENGLTAAQDAAHALLGDDTDQNGNETHSAARGDPDNPKTGPLSLEGPDWRGPTGAVWEMMKAEPNWLIWFVRNDGDKIGKVSSIDGSSPADRKLAASMNYKAAVDKAAKFNLAMNYKPADAGHVGVGYFPRRGAAVRMYDFDKCVEGGVIAPKVKSLLGETYCERSPSGTGIRALAAPVGDGADEEGSERNEFGQSGVDGKYFTFTGDGVPGVTTEIRPAPLARAAILEIAPPGGNSRESGWDGEYDPDSVEPENVLGRLEQLKAKNAKFAHRWAGGTDQLQDTSRSAFDLSNIGYLASAGFTFSETVHLMCEIYEPESRAVIDWNKGEERQMRRCFGLGIDQAQPTEKPSAEDEFEFVGPKVNESIAIIKPPFNGWKIIDPKSLRPPETIYSDIFTRGYLTVTTAAPKVGKSMLMLVEAIDMATGRGLIYGEKRKPLNVVYYNLEDDQNTLDARALAICDHYGIPQEELLGKLTASSGILADWCLMDGNDPKINEPAFGGLEKHVRENGIDILIVDPLQDASRSPETNEAFRMIGQRLRLFAASNQIAVGLVHHTRKMNAKADATIDDMRGGSALRGVARHNRVLQGMSPNDAAKYGIEDERLYFRFAETESNLTAPSGSRNKWFCKKSVQIGTDLANGNEGFPVGVVVPVDLKNIADTLEDREIAAIQAAVHFAESPPRKSSQANDWIGNLVASQLGKSLDVASEKKSVQAICNTLAARGYIVEYRAANSRSGRDSPAYKVGPNKPDFSQGVMD